MKTLLFLTAFILLTLSGFSQSQDPYLKMESLGYANGKHTIRVTNKQSCKADIQFRFGGSVTSVSPNPKNNTQQNEVAASSAQVFEITAPAGRMIEVKALSVCNWQGPAQWLSPLSVVLPVKFTKPFTVERKGARTFKVTIFVAEETNVSHYNINLSTDGLHYKTIALIFSGDTVAPGTYSATINL